MHRLLAYILVVSISSCYSYAMENDYQQEHEFHQRLLQTYPECFRQNVESYYKKLDPIISSQCKDINYWYCISVAIDNNRILCDENGKYHYNDLDFEVTIPDNFEPTRIIDIPIQWKDDVTMVRLTKVDEIKSPLLSALCSYSNLMLCMRNDKLSFQRSCIFRGALSINGQLKTIKVVVKNYRHESLVLRGMEIVFNKSLQKTYLFFDFADVENNAVNVMNPLIFSHAVISAPNLFCVRSKQLYHCNATQIYSYFGSLDVHQQWLPYNTTVYDQNNQAVSSLPKCYIPNETSRTLRKPIIYFLGDNFNSLYQIEEIEILKQNNPYVYSKEGALFLTRKCRITLRDFPDNNQLIATCLVQVPYPSLSLQPNVMVEGGQREWPTGVYKRSFSGDHISWQRIGCIDEPINISYGCEFQDGFKAIWPARKLNAQESKNWCQAAQQHFISRFEAKVSQCDRALLDQLNGFDRLTKLNISRINGANISWQDVYNSLALLRQLKELYFEHNNPVTNLFDDYSKNAERAKQCYQDLANSINRLENLKLLHLQGLWLKPQNQLGSGYNPSSWWPTKVSTEVATLTGIINHDNQAGIKALIGSICALRLLQNLSIDGLPVSGNSWWARLTNGQKVVAALPMATPLGLINISDGSQQSTGLLNLLLEVARITDMPRLRNITIYSPGGNCQEYFSHGFKEFLQESRSNSKATFSITDGVLD